MSEKINVNANIQAPIDVVWDAFTDPDAITSWNAASDTWHCPKAENDLRVGGRFLSRMEARDGSAGFDFTGTYTEVTPHERIAYTIDDGRDVDVRFTAGDVRTEVSVTFEAEDENSIEMQREGWQEILTNFKKYVERL